MGKPNPDASDNARRLSQKTLAAANAATDSVQVENEFNVSIQGTFNAAFVLERSFDGGTTFETVSRYDFSPLVFVAPVSAMVREPEDGVRYRVRCTSFTSGSARARISSR